jgi:hypothetical protein
MPSRRTAKQTVIWLLVLGGGWLQYLWTQTKHPSLVLKIWEVAYAVGGLVLIFALAVAAFYWVRDWAQRRRA